MSLLQEFKKFVMRGNVLDMAVGVIIGAAFGKIVSALVDKILMPVIGMLTSGVDFKELFVAIDRTKYADAVAAKGAITLTQATELGIPVIAYGEFINAIINFLIVAAAIFLMIKVVSSLHRKEESAPAPAAAPAPTKDQELLAEIRDLLKSNRA